jgi:hypothetical protein
MTKLHAGPAPSYFLINDEAGLPLASIHEGRDGLWWATLIRDSFLVLGPTDSREGIEAQARARSARGGAR